MAYSNFLKSSISSVGGLLSSLSSQAPGEPVKEEKQKPIHLSEHDFEDFAELLNLNDRVAFELSDGFSVEDLKKYELIPPRVIVVGLTSAGKSSLLERIIGHSIFPVRDSVCTRRPFRVQLKKDATVEGTILRFGHLEKDFRLPEDISEVRKIIETEQKSSKGEEEAVEFSTKEITAEIRSASKETFTFTDLPGIFLVSEKKMGKDYAASRAENEKLKKYTMDITKKYLNEPNTIVLLVISSTDWIHSMNNDNLISYLAEWLEEARKVKEVPVYGVITKLDTQTELASGSPIRRVLLNQLPKDHILRGLRVNKWIPVVSNPSVLAQGAGPKASEIEREAISACLRKSVPSQALATLPIGRSHLLRELKQALLVAISQTHGRMRSSIDALLLDLDSSLKKLPQPATPAEKRRLFDQRLKILETALNNLVGPRGNLTPVTSHDHRSLRMQLMVDAPAIFERDLNQTKLRGDMLSEVKQVLNQAALEAGGSFDSDSSFQSLSVKIIQRFTFPCLRLVDNCASIIRDAVRIAADKAFADYKQVNTLILEELGVPLHDGDKSLVLSFSSHLEDTSRPRSSSTGTAPPSLDAQGSDTSLTPALPRRESEETDPDEARSLAQTDQFFSEPSDHLYHTLQGEQPDMTRLFGFLKNSSTSKVLNLLDAFQTMACFHPMWRNFDLLHQNILLRETLDSDKREGKRDRDQKLSPEATLQEILNLPELAKIVKQEGDCAIETYEKTSEAKLSIANRLKIAKHFARVEVMGYIIRMSLISSVFPLVLRDLRDGLFRGVKFGPTYWEHSVSTLLRQRLVFDPENEKKVFALMEPSSEDVEKRDQLTKKRATLLTLKTDFLACQDKLRRLVVVLRS